MNYYISSICDYICNQLKTAEQNASGRQLMLIPSLPPDAILELSARLEKLRPETLRFRVARELTSKWAAAERSLLESSEYEATGSLTELRNNLQAGELILVGSAMVSDQESLADFHQVNDVCIWQAQMGGNFKSWLTSLWGDVAPQNSLEEASAILEALKKQYKLYEISCWLDKAGANGEELAELLQHMEVLKLPNMSGFLSRKQKKKGFSWYMQKAEEFFESFLFREQKNLVKFVDKDSGGVPAFRTKIREDGREDEEDPVCGSFRTWGAFLNALEAFIRGNSELANDLKSCDFVYLFEEILNMKAPPATPTHRQEKSKKLNGSPLEVLLKALQECLSEARERIRGGEELESIRILGLTFRHDFDDANDRARSELMRLLGGLGDFLSKTLHIPTAIESETHAELHFDLIPNSLRCLSAKSKVPSYDFIVELRYANNNQVETSQFDLQLPALHPYRISSTLLELTHEGISKEPDTYPILPIFQFPYYRELMVARDEDELHRIMLHCLRDRSQENQFLCNLFTEELVQDGPIPGAVEKLGSSYTEFIRMAYENGIYAALTPAEQGSYTQLQKAYQEAVDLCINHKKKAYAAMLMRAFLVLDNKDRREYAKHWRYVPHEQNAIVTILHPAMQEMLREQCNFLAQAFSYHATQILTAEDVPSAYNWLHYVEVAGMQSPLGGLLVDMNNILSVDVRGKNLLHRIGQVDGKDGILTTRLMTRYDNLDDENISDTDMFRETSESKLLLGLLKDFLKVHPHAQDGITMAIYRNDDVQPVLAAIDHFLKYLDENHFLHPGVSHYGLRLILFSDSADQSGILRWLEAWQERWEAAETEEKLKYYKCCRLVTEHRVVPREDRQKSLETQLKELRCDIMVFFGLIEAGRVGNRFKVMQTKGDTTDGLRFPIQEKAFCTEGGAGEGFIRSQILSNRQFVIHAAHTELLAYLKDETYIPKPHIIIGNGDFTPWRRVVDAAHQAAEWVVCIDPNIDVKLIREAECDGTRTTRELIGFGSGVGAHGENNLTVSCQIFSVNNLKQLLKKAFQEVYHFVDETEENTRIVSRLLKEGSGLSGLSGLSLIRALGPNYSKHDFLSYGIIQRMFIRKDDNLLCNKLFSVDTYTHWFHMKSPGDKKHPDLLWLQARIMNSRIVIDARLIECKMGKENEEHVEKAKLQIHNGLSVLTKIFTPLKEGSTPEPDSRYWYLQLHRMLAGSAELGKIEESDFLEAMENLAAGDFEILWSAAIFTFWTAKDTPPLRCTLYEEELLKEQAHIYTVGYRYIRHICLNETSPLSWPVSQKELNDTNILMNEAVLGVVEPEEALEDEYVEPNKDDDDEEAENVPVIEGADTDETVSPLGANTKNPATEGGDEHERKPRLSIPARIFLGTTNSRKIYWEFGHKQINNRHMLIFGNSGMGKTYAIQAILCEMGQQQLNSLIVDYTNGFLPNQLAQETNQVLHLKQDIIKRDKMPVNPLMKTTCDYGDGVTIDDTPLDVAKRVASLFSSVYSDMGSQQKAVLTEAIKEGFNRYGEEFVLSHLPAIMESFLDSTRHPRASVTTCRNKLQALVDDDLFVGQNDGISWDALFTDSHHRCRVFQLAGIDRETSRLLTEFALWDLYAAARNSGNEKNPKVLVLDEVQNLSQDLDAPLGKILTEGRKFGLCLIAATQILSGMGKDEQGRLFQAAHKLFFRPADPELKQTAGLLKMAAGRESIDYWSKRLSELGKGECISVGPVLNEATGALKATEVHRIKITALNERGF